MPDDDELTFELTGEPYQPSIVVLPDARLSSLVLEDTPSFVAEPVRARLIRRMSDRVIIGVEWEGGER